jgi:lipopolysaccharide/colanic/teichoic acid biosynthesis glycosyltransferase
LKIVITGASGHVGRQLVPLLQGRGIDLVLVGRDVADLAETFPGTFVSGYEGLASAGRGADLLVHLAVLNNGNAAALDQFERVNVDLAVQVLGLARDAGIRRFLNISTIHALDDANQSNYAVSKRNANARLHAESSGTPEVLTVFLPAVVGQRLSGKLAVLDRLPVLLRGALLMALSSLRPVVSIERLADFLVDAAHDAPMLSETILSDGQQSNPVFLFLKRFIDLGFAFAVIVLLWWLLILIWVWVKLQSPGPGIFSQVRVGKGGREFTCYKFRTMKVDTVQAATHEVQQSSVTNLGAFLRKSKLDELPQVLNIIMNQISLVGPRPCLPRQTELIEARRTNGSLNLKPGISGLGQVNKVDMSEPQRLAELDYRYGQLQSIILDIKIIVATALGRGGGDNVAKR